MIRVIIVLAVLFIGWQVTSLFINKNNGESASLQVTDSLLAKKPVGDSTGAADGDSIDTVRMGGQLDTVQKTSVTLPGSIDTKGVAPEQVVSYAKTLMGVPYLYGSTDPAKGFDCSGFITYVFNHFGIIVPRSSIDFTNVGKEVDAKLARPGDLILFTGTDSTERFVGHMGIVVANTDTLQFIHSTSGKANGVTITPLNAYYQGRYVKTVRIFPG
ncbi:C40 family peptidase [Flavisolibacter sp. BT320]|nr:C40 family peptidase [Flavisolibacter longurius]